MKNLFLFLFVCQFAQVISAQPCPQAAQIRSNVRTAYQAGLLDKALEGVKALRACDPAFDQEADQWTDLIFAEIKNQKRRAEEAERKAQREAANARSAQAETIKTLAELKQNTSNFWLSEAKNNFEKSYTYKALGCLLKAQELWKGNSEAHTMLDSMVNYCPDWTAMASGYVGSNKTHTCIGYYDESTKNGNQCDYVVRNVETGDTMAFRQVSHLPFPSMASEFSTDGKKVFFYTKADSTDHVTINVYDRDKKQTFQFDRALFYENWLSENGRTFVFLRDTLKDKNYRQICAFDFESESLHIIGKNRVLPGDWGFWISPDGENIAYCIDYDSLRREQEIGTIGVWNLKSKSLKTIENAYLHNTCFTEDGRYMVYQNGSLDNLVLMDLRIQKEEKGNIQTTRIEGYFNLVTVRIIDFGTDRKISTYDPIQKIWENAKMPEELNAENSSMEFVDDVLIYNFFDSTFSPRLGVYDLKKNQGFLFPQTYVASSPNGVTVGFNKSKNISTFIDFDRAVNIFDFENGQIRKVENVEAHGNDLRNIRLSITSDSGAWTWVMKNNLNNLYVKDSLCLVDRTGKISFIDSGYIKVAFFVEMGNKTVFIYITPSYNYQNNRLDYELVLFETNSGSRIRLKAIGSNQLSLGRGDFTDLWLDNERQLLVFSSAPKTFCVWDLAANKVIRTFKIEQEYENMELQGTSGLLQISFKNGIKKWIKIDAPTKPIQWHIDQLAKQK